MDELEILFNKYSQIYLQKCISETGKKYNLDESFILNEIISFLREKNPYIHGTNSSILPLLQYTEFKLLSPLDSIKNYGVTTLTGELTKGGWNMVESNNVPSFGVLKPSGRRNDQIEYTLQKIIKNYTEIQVITNKEDILRDLENAIFYSIDYAFSNINIILIYSVRALEFGFDISKILSSDFFNNLEIHKEIFKTILYLDTDIVANPNIKNFEEYDLPIHDSLNYKILFNKIKKLNLTAAEVIKLFELPKEQKDFSNNPYELSITNIFVANDKKIIYRRDQKDNKNPKTMAQGLFYRNRFNSFLLNYLQNEYSNETIQNLKIQIYEYLSELNLREKLLKSLVIEPKLHVPQIDVVSLITFPIILFATNSSKFILYDNTSQEYRAKEPLKFGNDIIRIATNTLPNKKYLVNFFAKHNITIDIILFEDIHKLYF